MLSSRLFLLLPFQMQIMGRWHFSQTKLDILASNYHKMGRVHFKRSLAVEKALTGRIATIERLIN